MRFKTDYRSFELAEKKAEILRELNRKFKRKK